MFEILQNPIDGLFLEEYNNSNKRILIAAPFISTYVKIIFKSRKIDIDKKIIIRLNDSDISTYNLDAIKYLLNLGFKVRYLNSIHLKLYIFDNQYIISSSNLTQNGLINNIELSIKSEENPDNVVQLFNEVWKKAKNNDVTLKYIDENWNRYLLLKKQSHTVDSTKKVDDQFKKNVLDKLDVNNLLSYIIQEELPEYNKNQKLIYEANKIRNKRIKELKRDYKSEMIYVKEKNHLRRKNCLFYDLLHGPEFRLASTGMFENQLREIVTNDRFIDILIYILPEAFNLPKWNFIEKNQYYNFCTGIFEIKIKQFVEVIPIRLISYFYPDYFLPIFKIDHLQEMCSILGFEKQFDNRGDSLFYYNRYLLNILKSVPSDNYIKSMILYSLLYCVKLYKSFINGLSYEEHIKKNNYTKLWIKEYTAKGLTKLKSLKLIK